MLSYMARVSRTKRARSSSDFGINRMTSPIFAPNLNWGRVSYEMSTIMLIRRSAQRLGAPSRFCTPAGSNEGIKRL